MHFVVYFASHSFRFSLCVWFHLPLSRMALSRMALPRPLRERVRGEGLSFCFILIMQSYEIFLGYTTLLCKSFVFREYFFDYGMIDCLIALKCNVWFAK